MNLIKKNIEATRHDIGQYLFHFTKRTEKRTASSVLNSILKGKKIVGGKGFVLSNDPCVCFTEAPLLQLIQSFNLQSRKEPAPRYEPFGIGILKSQLFQQGGRPVIYQKRDEFSLLPHELRFRHVTYDPPTTDFTWEREWRIKCNEFAFKFEDVIVVVPSISELLELNDEYAEVLGEPETEYSSACVYSRQTLPGVSLDVFGLQDCQY